MRTAESNREHVDGDEARRGRAHESVGAAEAGDEPADQHDPDDGDHEERPPRDAPVGVAGEPRAAARRSAPATRRASPRRPCRRSSSPSSARRPAPRSRRGRRGRSRPRSRSASGTRESRARVTPIVATASPHVEDGDEAERERHRARQVALGPPEVAGELRDRLPADEQPDEDVRRGADRPPAVRRERRPVVAAARRQRDAIATAITTISTDESASWKPEETRRPNAFAVENGCRTSRARRAAATGVPEPVRSAT